MIISPSQNSDNFTASAATSSENGSRDSALELATARRQPKPLMKNTSPNGQADNQGLTSTSGMPRRRLPCSTACVIHGPFTILSNGGIGQTICDADGNAVAWTTDVMVAQVICRLMNENERLLVAAPLRQLEVARLSGSQPECER